MASVSHTVERSIIVVCGQPVLSTLKPEYDAVETRDKVMLRWARDAVPRINMPLY